MWIHKKFTSGNIKVVSTNGNIVTLENELRDTIIDWFYWAFLRRIRLCKGIGLL